MSGIGKSTGVSNTTLKTIRLGHSLPILRCPPTVMVCCKSASELNTDVLLAEEASATTNFSEKRLAEFKLGRACARELLTSLGYADFPVRVGESRQPLWPDGLIGSISHTREFALCAIAPQQQITGLGIDIEVIEQEAFDLLAMVTSSEELERIRAKVTGCHYLAKLLFSAKESVFKCQFTFTGEWLEFKDVSLNLDFVRRLFTTSIKDHDSLFNISGTWDVTDRHIVTAAWISQRIEFKVQDQTPDKPLY